MNTALIAGSSDLNGSHVTDYFVAFNQSAHGVDNKLCTILFGPTGLTRFKLVSLNCYNRACRAVSPMYSSIAGCRPASPARRLPKNVAGVAIVATTQPPFGPVSRRDLDVVF